jgi:hypothetical protein
MLYFIVKPDDPARARDFDDDNRPVSGLTGGSVRTRESVAFPRHEHRAVAADPMDWHDSSRTCLPLRGQHRLGRGWATHLFPV